MSIDRSKSVKSNSQSVRYYDARKVSPASSQLLAEKILFLSQSGQLHYKELISQVEKNGVTGIDETKLSKFIKSHTTNEKIAGGTLTPFQHRGLIEFLQRSNYWSSRSSIDRVSVIDNCFYYSMLVFMDIHSDDTENVRLYVPGNYRVYSPSLWVPNGFTVGSAIIYNNDEHDPIHVKEYYRYTGRFDTGKFKINEIIEEYFGYIFRKGSKYFIISKDRSQSGVQVTLLPDCFRQDENVDHIFGMVLGMQGSRPFTCRTYFERTSDSEEKLQADSDVYMREDIPTSILAIFDETQPEKAKEF